MEESKSRSKPSYGARHYSAEEIKKADASDSLKRSAKRSANSFESLALAATMSEATPDFDPDMDELSPLGDEVSPLLRLAELSPLTGSRSLIKNNGIVQVLTFNGTVTLVNWNTTTSFSSLVDLKGEAIANQTQVIGSLPFHLQDQPGAVPASGAALQFLLNGQEVPAETPLYSVLPSSVVSFVAKLAADGSPDADTSPFQSFPGAQTKNIAPTFARKQDKTSALGTFETDQGQFAVDCKLEVLLGLKTGTIDRILGFSGLSSFGEELLQAARTALMTACVITYLLAVQAVFHEARVKS